MGHRYRSKTCDRRRAVAFAAVTAAVMVLAPFTGAGAKAAKAGGRGGGKTTTSFLANSGVFDNCQDGATCTHSASADRTGAQAAATSANRPGAFAEDEWSSAFATGGRTLTLDAPAREVRVKYTWRTVAAKSEAIATGPEGAAAGRVFAKGSFAGCKGCEFVDDATHGKGSRVVDAYAYPGESDSDVATGGEIVSHSFTVRGAGGGAVPAGKYTLWGTTRAFSYIGCARSTFYFDGAGLDPVSTGCLPQLVGHSGSASSEATMQLLEIAAEVVT